MMDNEVYRAIQRQMLAQMQDVGILLPVIVGFQPTKSAKKDSFVMFFPLNEASHGWQVRSYHVAGTDAGHKETQLVEKSLQVQGLVTDANELTATDVVATVRMIVNSLPFVDALKKQGIGVQRASGIRTPYLINEQGDYEQHPSFDFNVTFHREIFPKTSALKALHPDIYHI